MKRDDSRHTDRTNLSEDKKYGSSFQVTGGDFTPYDRVGVIDK